MKSNETIISGRLVYREIEFVFIFKSNELRLIPPNDKKHIIQFDWILTSIGNGGYSFGNPLTLEVPYLLGICNENGHEYVFLTRIGEVISTENATLIIPVIGYIDSNKKLSKMCKLSFYSTEINYIYPTNNIIEYDYNWKEFEDKGKVLLKTTEKAFVSTDNKSFFVDSILVSVSFGTIITVNSKTNEPPLIISSIMDFEFEETGDYSFILRLYRLAKEFISFLCYRKNISSLKAYISIPYQKDKTIKAGELHIIDRKIDNERELLEKGRYIKQLYIDGAEGNLLSDIAQNILYTRHIPESHMVGLNINAARFVMITSAFEWEFNRSYPDGIPRKEQTIKVEKQVEEELERLINSSTGRLKEKYRFLKRFIRTDSLQSEIVKTLEDYDSVIGCFGKYLYNLNNEKLDYSEVGKRIADQRNHFAHGDVDKDFIGTSLLDLVYLEYIIYAMQLRRCGVTDENIRKAINDLFGLHYIV